MHKAGRGEGGVARPWNHTLWFASFVVLGIPRLFKTNMNVKSSYLSFLWHFLRQVSFVIFDGCHDNLQIDDVMFCRCGSRCNWDWWDRWGSRWGLGPRDLLIMYFIVTALVTPAGGGTRCLHGLTWHGSKWHLYVTRYSTSGLVLKISGEKTCWKLHNFPTTTDPHSHGSRGKSKRK